MDAIIHTLKMWRHYLIRIKITLIIDHGGPKYLFEQPKLNESKSRWLATLSEFNFEIKYIKGKENLVVETLSQRVQLNHSTSISSSGIDLEKGVKNVGQHDEKYKQLKDKLL